MINAAIVGLRHHEIGPSVQVTKVGISSDLANMLPYLITIVVLMFPINRARQPAALNKPFERGEN